MRAQIGDERIFLVLALAGGVVPVAAVAHAGAAALEAHVLGGVVFDLDDEAEVADVQVERPAAGERLAVGERAAAAAEQQQVDLPLLLPMALHAADDVDPDAGVIGGVRPQRADQPEQIAAVGVVGSVFGAEEPEHRKADASPCTGSIAPCHAGERRGESQSGRGGGGGKGEGYR